MTWVDAAATVVSGLGIPRVLPARGPLILMYHGVGGPDGVAPEAFAAQLDLLLERRRVVSLADALALLGRPQAAEVAALTFDDGYRDFARLALPVLARRALHATVFVPAAHVGGSNTWDEGRAARRDILSSADLRALDPARAEIGAHGLQHRRLAGLPAHVLVEETARARRRLEDLCGTRVRLFAYPYGQRDDFDLRAERAVADAGFLAACSTCFGRGSTPGERFRLRRVAVRPGDDLRCFVRKLDGAYDWTAWKEGAGVRWRRVRRRGGRAHGDDLARR